MSRNVSPFKIGLLILVCGSIGLASLIWLGASHLFEKKTTYVSYFDESVKGLQKDAVVNFRGVGVGRVTAIRLGPDGRLIEVLMGLDPKFHVQNSFAIQLREQGLTGLRYLEIDTAPPNIAQLTPSITFQVQYPLIPSYPSDIAQLKSALETIYAKVTALDIKSLTTGWTEVAQHINTILVQFEGAIQPQDWRDTVKSLKKTAQESAAFMDRLKKSTSQAGMNKGFKDLAATLAATREATETLSKQLKALPPDSLSKISKDLEKTINAGGKLLSSTDQHVNDSAVSIQQSLQQLQILLSQLNALVQTLKDQPNRLLFSPKAPNPFERR